MTKPPAGASAGPEKDWLGLGLAAKREQLVSVGHQVCRGGETKGRSLDETQFFSLNYTDGAPILDCSGCFACDRKDRWWADIGGELPILGLALLEQRAEVGGNFGFLRPLGT